MAKRTNNDSLVSAAEGVGTTLGHLAGRIDAWQKQRDELAAEVRKAIARGQEILAQLGHTADPRAAAEPAETRPRAIAAPPVAVRRTNPTARHDASVSAKAQHAAERAKPRASYRGQNR